MKKELKRNNKGSCPSCDAAISPDQKFCGQCGTLLNVICTKCRAKNPRSSNFCISCGAELIKLQPPVHKKSENREERRWVTVLFADMSGFTSMSEKIDAEDVKNIAHRAIERLSESIQCFGGSVLNVMGDAVMAVFGAPIAHGDDAQRAVRAALAIQALKLTEDPNFPLSVHIGINTGKVMSGLMGPEGRRDYTVMGDTVNTASRLESAAPSGSIFVGIETWRSTQRTIKYRKVGKITAKGKSELLQVWEPLEVIEEAELFHYRGTPFLGRSRELEILNSFWSKVLKYQRPHIINIVAEPGVGKSRLLYEWEKNISANALVLKGGCLPYGEMSGYRALAQVLKKAIGLSDEVTPSEARNILEHFVQKLAGEHPKEIESPLMSLHLALMLGVGTEKETASNLPDSKILNMSIRYFFEALALRKPLCLIIEDIHWADEGFLLLIEFISKRIQKAPFLMITCARPELKEKHTNWGIDIKNLFSLDLKPLSRASTHELICDLYSKTGMSKEVVGNICNASGGNPLFVEEFVTAITEKRKDKTLPSSIRSLIASRLDRLQPKERSVIRFAAVMGRIFWRSAVEASGLGKKAAGLLKNLVTRSFIYRTVHSQIPEDDQYEFKHALVRDVVYEMIPRKERPALHSVCLNWMEKTFGEQTIEQIDILAYHAVEAQKEKRAVHYLKLAGNKAHQIAANKEAIILFTRAIKIAEKIGEKDSLALLHYSCGKAFAALGQWENAKAEMEEGLIILPGRDAARRAEVLIDLSMIYFWLFNIKKHKKLVQQAIELAKLNGLSELEDAALESLACAEGAEGKLRSGLKRYKDVSRLYGGSLLGTRAATIYATRLYWIGKMSASIEKCREVIAQARKTGDTFSYMHSSTTYAMSMASMGKYKAALRIFKDVRKYGKEYEVGNMLARGVSMIGGTYQQFHDYSEAANLAEEAKELASSANFPPTVISANLDKLFIFIQTGKIGKAEALLPEVITSVKKSAGWHGWLWKIRLLTAQAEFNAARKNKDEAMKYAEEALKESRAKNRVKYECLALQAKAHAFMLSNDKAAAIECQKTAIEVARPIKYPCLLLDAIIGQLNIEGEQKLLKEAKAIVKTISDELPSRNVVATFKKYVKI